MKSVVTLTYTLLQLFICLQLTHASVPNISPLFIDSGSKTGHLDEATHIQWLPDSGYTNASFKTIPSSNLGFFGNLSSADQTLAVWDGVNSSCYQIPVDSSAPGIYYIRLSFCYNDYDGNYTALSSSQSLPSIGVAIEDFFVEAVAEFGVNTTAYYTDFVVPIADGVVSICFIPIETTIGAVTVSPPFVNSVEVAPTDSNQFQSEYPTSVLSNWFRVNAGGPEASPSPNQPNWYKSWSADYRSTDADSWTSASLRSLPNVNSNYSSYAVPDAVWQSARVAGGDYTGYHFTNIHPVDPTNNFLVVLYFAEPDSSVKPGDRVFSIYANTASHASVDLASQGGVAVYQLETTLMNLNQSAYVGWFGDLKVVLSRDSKSKKPPVLSGLEVYEIIGQYSPIQLEHHFEVRIDSGAELNYTDGFGNPWVADSYFFSGSPVTALSPDNSFSFAPTLRYFDPIVSSVTNCYAVPVPLGTYLVRGFFDYASFEQESSKTSPSFTVAVEGVSLATITPNAPGQFETVTVYVSDGEADFCLTTTSSRPSFINSLEVIQVNDSVYSFSAVEVTTSLLYSLYTVSFGGDTFGDLLSNATNGLGADEGHRQWYSDNETLSVSCSPSACTPVAKPSPIAGSNEDPNFWPAQIYQTALTAPSGSSSSLTVPLQALLPGVPTAIYLLLAELDPVVKSGDRVFTVSLGTTALTFETSSGINTSSIDILAIAGKSLTAVNLHALVTVPGTVGGSPVALNLTLSATNTSKYGPTLNAFEVKAVFAKPLPVKETNAAAMSALRTSLLPPEFVGWQGDVCSPSPWPGVTCNTSPDNSSFIVTAINLSGKGLRGYISDDVGSLSNLTSLNLSANSLIDNIPFSLTSLSFLASLDLSYNHLNGSIPDGLAALPLLKTLLLQDNELSGPVPSDLLSAPSSLQNNLTDNVGLCGGASYPACSSPPAAEASLSPPPASSTGSSSKGSSAGPIVGGLVAGIVVIALIGAVVVFLLQQKRKSTSELDILERDRPPPVTSRRRNPYWRSKTGEFEMMNSGHDI